MSLKQIKQKTDGFTIIEVLIVLAIAGLIMLVVFLAVPALQRNQRNSARTSDASRISALVSECMGNRNGVVASCDTEGEIGYDGTKFSQLSTMSTPTTTSAATTTLSANDQVTYGFTHVCTDDGSANTSTGATARQFVVMYRLETSSGTQDRCIGS
jgi:prepilin-type N-terminal cleavage/methylation domain-containing protein